MPLLTSSGFSDQSYFTKVFQKHTGRTPGEYRRLHHAPDGDS